MVEMSVIYVVSDTVGETAELITKSVLSQFHADHVQIKRFPYVENKANIDEVISLAKYDQGMIVYTLVDGEIRQYMKETAMKEGICACDIVGPLMEQLSTVLGLRPIDKPYAVQELDEDYYKKIEAIEFAVKYDDGRDPRGILKADIVLIGVSRTSKTPLSQYLAHKRLKVANVPIVPEVEPPEELFAIPKYKCFGLRISPEKLAQIRRERLISLGLDSGAAYARLDRVVEELENFDKLASRIGCRVIDVTNKAIEESANTILYYYYNDKEQQE